MNAKPLFKESDLVFGLLTKRRTVGMFGSVKKIILGNIILLVCDEEKELPTEKNTIQIKDLLRILRPEDKEVKIFSTITKTAVDIGWTDFRHNLYYENYGDLISNMGAGGALLCPKKDDSVLAKGLFTTPPSTPWGEAVWRDGRYQEV